MNFLTSINETELLEELVRLNNQNLFGYSFDMPLSMIKFRDY